MITVETYLANYDKRTLSFNCIDSGSLNFFTVEVRFRFFREWVRKKGYLDLKLAGLNVKCAIKEFRIGIIEFIRDFLSFQIIKEFIQDYQELTD